MVYSNFQLFIFICFIFGIGKLNISTANKSRLSLLSKIWSLGFVASIVLCYVLWTTTVIDINFNRLGQISNLNNLLVNVTIILLNMICGNKEYEQLYRIISTNFKLFKLDEVSKNNISLKIYVFFTVPLIIFIIVITLEAIYIGLPFALLLRIPTFLTILYVTLHLHLLLFVLKINNHFLLAILLHKYDVINVENMKNKNVFSLFKLNSKLRFEVKRDFVDLRALCKVYDDASTCICYLETLHGLQIVLAIWLAFSNAVVGVTEIACHQNNHPWLIIASSFLPFFWCLMACYIEDQLVKEAKQTETLVVKHLIDYHCDQTSRNVLQNFKQLLSTNRLTFTAGNVFRLEYGLILSTVINVITYSIILIQFFQPN